MKLLILGGGLVVVSGGLCFLLAALGTFDPKVTMPSAEERALLVTVHDIEPFVPGPIRLRRTRENFQKLEHPFGSGIELVYEFEWTHPERGLYIQSGASFFERERDARNTFIGMDVGLGVGLAVESDGVRREEMPSTFAWGDQSKTSRIVGPEGPAGTFFVTRKGKRVYYFIIGGVYFDDAETLEALLAPKLEAFETFEITRTAD